MYDIVNNYFIRYTTKLHIKQALCSVKILINFIKFSGNEFPLNAVIINKMLSENIFFGLNINRIFEKIKQLKQQKSHLRILPNLFQHKITVKLFTFIINIIAIYNIVK